LKLADRFRDVTAERREEGWRHPALRIAPLVPPHGAHRSGKRGERLVITNYGSWDGSATAKWEKIVPKKNVGEQLGRRSPPGSSSE
jgi:hypothetical protein